MEILFQTPSVLVGLIGLLGLMVGSFLNVVIHRLPIMMERGWRRECRDYLGIDAPADETESTFNLALPRSHCPVCRKTLSLLENIPIVSYVCLGGRCSACKTKISMRYPAVELLTGLLSMVVAWKFGPTVQLFWALLLTWGLVALSLIDLDKQLLPDDITLPLLWLGQLLSVFNVFSSTTESILGAIGGYLILWTVYQLFRLTTGKEGMGYGDFKLLAMLGAWLGWSSLPLIIVMSSVVGALSGVFMILFFDHDRRVPIPFGPYLACAGWLTLLYGDSIMNAYLGSF